MPIEKLRATSSSGWFETNVSRFDVVAKEVRKLSVQVEHSISEVKENIEGIVREIEQVTENITRVSQNVEETHEQIHLAIQDFAEIWFLPYSFVIVIINLCYQLNRC